METENLKTASTYVNNLLLARGLLRDGTPIDFTKASASDGSKSGTLARVINLVHDLVLRRDRETDSLTDLSATLTQLRASTAEHTQKISRLEARNAELERQASQATLQEQTAKASLKAAEMRNRGLREEAARLKASASQVRAQCSHDVRKRDAEIRRLQKYLDARRRDGGGSQLNTTIITPGVSKPSGSHAPVSHNSSAASASYSLQEETTSFLTQLSQSLSDENDGLIALVQTTLTTLRSLQGIPEPDPEEGDASVSCSAPPSREALAEEMETALSALRALLTNPSFVPLEEVAVRDEEILRLRAGFERIEGKWKEAIGLMDGWRRRMLDSGGSVDLDDLRCGLRLGSEHDLRKSTYVAVADAEDHDAVPRRASKRVRILEREPSPTLEDDELRAEAELAANVESPLERAEQPLYPILAQKQATEPQPAVDAHGHAPQPKPPKPAFARAPPLRPTTANARPVSIHANSPAVGALVAALSDDEDDIALLEAEAYRGDDEENEAPLSVAQKLEETRRDADDERRRRDLREAEWNRRTVEREKLRAEQDAAASHDGLRRTGSKRKADAEGADKAVKRTAIPRRTGRGKRRSTLSPEELEGLMGL